MEFYCQIDDIVGQCAGSKAAATGGYHKVLAQAGFGLPAWGHQANFGNGHGRRA